MIYIMLYLLFSIFVFLLCCYTSLKLVGEVTYKEFVIFLFFGFFPILNIVAFFSASVELLKKFGDKPMIVWDIK